MKNKAFAILFLFAFSCGFTASAQEFLTGFSTRKSTEKLNRSVSRDIMTTTSLPFFDDFTTSRVYPDSTKWETPSVLVNSGFPIYSTNYQAATFDVLNQYGEVYSNASSNPFIADSLISVRIRLDSVLGDEPRALSPADSIYFSFYYQPQGNGDAPEATDSLVLQFGYDTLLYRIDSITCQMNADILANMGVDTVFAGDTIYNSYIYPPNDCNPELFIVADHQMYINEYFEMPCDTVYYIEKKWNHIWSSPGMPLDSFCQNCDETHEWFRQVMIPITDEKFFTDDFQILFYNYATLPTTMYPNDRSNVDQWSIDFVYLNEKRNQNDKTYPKVSFSQNSPSLLSRYQSMPYRQYKNNPTAAVDNQIQMYITNLDSISHLTKYQCIIQQIGSNWSFDYESKSCILKPYFAYGFQDCEGDNATEACPTLSNFLFNFNDNADSASFLIRHYIDVVDGTEVKGDSIYYRQGFYNYYAYDDGIPEMGYGVNPDGSYFAVQFKVSTMDTLRGVQLLFNQTFNDANYQFFDIVVWNDNNGKPGNEIYRLRNQRPEWDENILYKFAYYTFDDIVRVNSTFYVGIMQQESASINIGFDSSIDNHQYNFYNSGNGWRNSVFPGSLMIRPVVGKSYYIGIDENELNVNDIKLYPNPATNTVHLNGINADNCQQISIFDMTGRMVQQNSRIVDIDVSGLSNGLYVVRILTEDGQSIVKKCMISK